jgi:hypothetical protein
MKINNIFRTLQGGLLVAIGLLLTTVSSVQASYESTVLNDHPLAYYALDLTIDNSGTATDLSGNGNNSSYYVLSPTAGPTAYIPNAAYFGGSGAQSFVDLSSGANAGILNFGGLITMEAWVQSTNTTQGPADIIGKGYDSSLSYNELVLRANGGVNYYGGTYNNTNGGASASGGQQTTNWTYLVSTYDGTNWNLYVNTKLVGQGADTVGAINFSDPWAIGTGSADGFSRFFQGTICQLAMYTNALTPAQVLNHYYEAELNAPSATSAPIIVTQPQSQSVFLGGTVTFSVGAVSALPTTNQWYANSVAIAGQTSSTLTIMNVGSSTASTNYSVVVGSANGKTNSAAASVTLLATGNSLKWNSAGGNGVWDSGISANWLNLNTSAQTVFNTNDQVLFDDTVGVSNSVTVNGTVSPSLMTVNSSTNNFSFNSGAGSPVITGVGTLLKEGSSVLSIFTPQSFSGLVKINGGTVYAGNNCFNLVSSISITNNSTLDFGGGSLTGNKPLTISGTGVTNEGALFNSYPYATPGNVMNVTLAGNTTFGGTARWDYNGGTLSGPYKVTVNWTTTNAAYGQANNYGEWNTVTISPNVGDIEVATGKLGIKSMGSTFGNPAANVLVDPGTELDFWTSDSGYARNFHVLSGGQMQILAGIANFGGNVMLESNANFNTFGASAGSANYGLTGSITLNGIAHILVGETNLVFSNPIGGAGGFVWDAYNHEIVLQAANTYSGPTVIGGGLTLALSGNGSISHSSLIWLGGATIDVSGRPDNTLALTSGQTIAGIGTITGQLVVPVGATISPAGTNITLGLTEGSSITGAISAGNNIALNGNTVMKLNGSGVSDEVVSSTKIAFGGTLTLANVSGAPLAVGNSFQLFSAPSMTGTFSSISPATPGPGLAWDTSQLNSFGTLNVIAGASQPVVSSVRILSGNLIFSGSGGTANANYAVLTTTNVTTPLTLWTSLVTNSFDNTGAFSVTNAISSGTPQRYYRLKLVP